jgi:hypothetical protein
MAGYSPDESMIDSSPFLWAVKLVEGRCSMRKATAVQRADEISRRHGPDDLFSIAKTMPEKPVSCGPTRNNQSKTHRDSTCARACTQCLTLT